MKSMTNDITNLGIIFFPTNYANKISLKSACRALTSNQKWITLGEASEKQIQFVSSDGESRLKIRSDGAMFFYRKTDIKQLTPLKLGRIYNDALRASQNVDPSLKTFGRELNLSFDINKAKLFSKLGMQGIQRVAKGMFNSFTTKIYSENDSYTLVSVTPVEEPLKPISFKKLNVVN